MELVKDVVVDFCLFSLIEGFILCKFYERICKVNRFKINEIFVLSLINCLISTILPPLFYQITIILWIGVFLKIFKKIKYIIGVKYGLLSMIFVLITEMIYNFIIEVTISLDGFCMNDFKLFILIIPIKIIQILLILYFGGNKIETLVRTNT